MGTLVQIVAVGYLILIWIVAVTAMRGGILTPPPARDFQGIIFWSTVVASLPAFGLLALGAIVNYTRETRDLLREMRRQPDGR